MKKENPKPAEAAPGSGEHAEAVEKVQNSESPRIFTLKSESKLAPKVNVLGKIDLDALNQSTRPKKKSKEERKKEREEKAQQQRGGNERKKRVRIGKERVDIEADYLKTLSVGTHKLTVVYTDGECSTNFEVKKAEGDKTDPAKPAGDKDTTSPQTGDNSNMFLWVALLFVSGGVLTVFSVASKKKRVGINK